MQPEHQKSPLDDPLSPIYVWVLVLELAIVVGLFILGRMLS